MAPCGSCTLSLFQRNCRKNLLLLPLSSCLGWCCVVAPFFWGGEGELFWGVVICLCDVLYFQKKKEPADSTEGVLLSVCQRRPVSIVTTSTRTKYPAQQQPSSNRCRPNPTHADKTGGGMHACVLYYLHSRNVASQCCIKVRSILASVLLPCAREGIRTRP